ncbi:MAG: transglycosylase domain-containing protein [Chloroflexota bacterium]
MRFHQRLEIISRNTIYTIFYTLYAGIQAALQCWKVIASGAVLLMVILASLVYQYLLVDLPHPDQLYHRTSAVSTNIFDRNGVLLYQITDPHQGQHSPLSLSDIPQTCIDATISTEDVTFFNNPGFDTWAMLRALISNVQAGEIVSGASTITQQLARNLLFSPAERTEISLTRKFREIILAWRLTQTYSKDEILTLYFNETYYGNLAHGIGAASNIYFGKSASELDLAECALLAGLPQNPVIFNPLENLAGAKARQADVLTLMVKHKMFDEETANLAGNEKLQFAAIPFPIKAPHFVMYVRGQLEKQFGLEAIYTQGLQVHTTLDLTLQRQAEQTVRFRLAELSKPEPGVPPRNVRNAAVITLDPATGEILTMVGSPNYFEPRIDGAVNATVAPRQPGSSIKPLTYAAAFDPTWAERYNYQPLTPATLMLDVRTAFQTKEGNPYVPQNYDRRWRGPVLLRESLAASYNLVAVKVLDYIGLPALIDLSRQMGITTFDEAEAFGLALTLGGGEVHLMELTAAYAAFANGGYQVEPTTIQKITQQDGQILYQPQRDRIPAVLDAKTAYLITDILSDNLARAGAFGEGSPLRLPFPSAAKTGTTTDFRDNWTVGYSPHFVTGVWVGNADNEPMRHVSGITGAAPIWRDVMTAIHKDRPKQAFAIPEGLTTETVCALNGLLPSEGCRYTLDEIFITGTQPSQQDDWHRLATIDRRTGLLAGSACSSDLTLTRWFVQYPLEAKSWVERQQIDQMPDQYSPFCPDDPPIVQGNTGQKLAALMPENTRQSAPEPFRLTSPDAGSTYRISPAIPVTKQKIRVAIQIPSDIDSASVQLFVNDEWLGSQTDLMWQLTPGQHQFHATGINGQGETVETGIIVIDVQ